MTDGAKFGADFLAYPGDPLRYHAQLVVTCVTQDPTEMTWRHTDLVSKCRLATTVKKTATFAYLDEKGTVQYQRLVRNDKKK